MFEMALPESAGPGNDATQPAMIADVGAAVLAYVGFAPDAIASMTAEMRTAARNGSANRLQACRVAFHAHDGEIQIAISYDGVSAWRTARPLP